MASPEALGPGSIRTNQSFACKLTEAPVALHGRARAQKLLPEMSVLFSLILFSPDGPGAQAQADTEHVFPDQFSHHFLPIFVPFLCPGVHFDDPVEP